MSQDVRARAVGAAHKQAASKHVPVVHCGDRPGDLRVKVERRRSRGRLEQASLRVRAIVSRVKTR